MSTRFSRQNRDAGLRRVAAITRWTLAGALAGTGFFAGLASQSRSGSVASRSTTPGTGASSSGGTQVATVPTDDGGTGFTQTPPPAPTVLPSSNNFAPIVSGAS